MARELRRINTNIPVDMLELIDEYAEKLYINRTSAMLVLMNIGLDQAKVISTMDSLVKMIGKEQTKKMLQEGEKSE